MSMFRNFMKFLEHLMQEPFAKSTEKSWPFQTEVFQKFLCGDTTPAALSEDFTDMHGVLSATVIFP